MFISPMLLNRSDHPFDDDSYITELKVDGIRLIWTKFHDKVRLYTRYNNECTAIYPEITNIDLPNGTVLDGEIVVSDELGRPDFEATMKRFRSKKAPYEVQYCVFDVIQFNGEKIVHLPLIKRKELLQKVVPSHPHINVVQWFPGNAIAYFDLVKQNQLEGIVQKKADSPYEINKRSYNWLKVINYQYDNVYITGIRKEKFGVLLSFLNGTTAGIMEFMAPDKRKTLYSTHKVISENEKFKFIEPIKCRVKYRNLTKQGKLRIPSFVEWL